MRQFTNDEVKVIIFDFDGTLMQSVKFNYISINKALKELGHNCEAREEDIRGHLGEIAEEFYGNILPKEAAHDWQNIRMTNRKLSGEYILKHAEAFPGVKETLKELKNRGYKVVLYSNCSEAYFVNSIKALELEDIFDYKEYVSQNNIPKIKLVKKISDIFGGAKCAVVGDRIHDVEAARENGFVSVGCLYGYGKEEPKEADVTIENFEELLKVFK